MTLPATPNRSLIHPNPTPHSSGPIRITGPGQSPPGFYKSIFLEVLGVFAALALGYAYSGYLNSSFPLWFSIGAFSLFGITSSIQVFLEKNTGRRAFVILAETLAFAVWFAFVDLRILASVLAILFVLLLWGYLQSRSELAYTTEIRFFRTTRGAVGKAATAVILAMILLYLPQVDQGKLFVGEDRFKPFYDWASGAFSSFYPGILVSGSFSDFASSIVQQDLRQNPSYQALKPAEQASTTRSATRQFVDSFSKRLGISVATGTPTSNVVYDSITHGLQGMRDRLQGWFFAAWALALFLIARGLGVLLVWITQLLSLVFYEILLAAGFMKVVQHPDVKEVVEY